MNRKFIYYIVITLIGIELLARFIGFGDPILYKPSFSGYEIIQNQEKYFLLKKIHYNNFGMRNKNTGIIPKNGIYRILTIGDSVNNGGNQIDNRETYQYRLEDLYKKIGKEVEVLNVSSGGWSILNEYNWIVDHGFYGASLIILEVNEGDLYQDFIDASILDKNDSFPQKKPLLALQEIYIRYFLPQIDISHSKYPEVTSKTLHQKTAKIVLKTIEKFHDLAKKNNCKMIILYWDSRVQTRNNLIKTARLNLFDLAEFNNIPILRPSSFFKDIDSDVLYRDSIHPSIYGNKEMAKIIFSHLKL
nr:SGNH/GDSL hydrolase family protein [uncultured Rhodoferax sp.]